MEKKMIYEREMCLGASTEEIINLFKALPKFELECSSAVTRWLKYDRWRCRIGITDNIYHDWYSLNEFRKFFGKFYWNFFIM